jgi:hypothetical protein
LAVSNGVFLRIQKAQCVNDGRHEHLGDWDDGNGDRGAWTFVADHHRKREDKPDGAAEAAYLANGRSPVQIVSLNKQRYGEEQKC